MRFVISAAAQLLLLQAAASAAEPAKIVKGTASDGTRFYEDSLVVRAPVKTLWAAFTDTEAYRKWSVPVAAIDFRLGGVVEASYDPKGHLGDPQNVKNEFIAYIPERLLVFRNIQAPDRLPGKEAYGKTVKTVEFQPLGPSETRVTVSGVGFAAGEDFNKLYAFFSAGDAEMLESLKGKMETP